MLKDSEMFIPKAVVFDMDGLMLDTESVAFRANRQTARILGLPIEDQWFLDIVGMNKAGAERYLADRLGYDLPETFDETFIRLYGDAVSKGIQLKNGLIELFKYLDANDIRRAVATSTRTHMAKKKLSLTGIDHWFEHTICGDMVENGKPAPDIYLKAARALNIEPRDCLALEDSDNGAAAAYTAGIKVIVVPDLKKPTQKTVNIAHQILPDLNEVKAYLAEQQHLSHQHAS